MLVMLLVEQMATLNDTCLYNSVLFKSRYCTAKIGTGGVGKMIGKIIVLGSSCLLSE